MDPRRNIEEKYNRKEIPFWESYREIISEPQSLGNPIEREIIVIRLDKSKLQIYTALLFFMILIVIIGMIAG